jgi:hypothetical protein
MDYFHSPLPDLVFESQGALGCQWRIGFNSDNNVSEVEIIGRVVTIVKANIENKISIPTIRASHCGAESVDPRIFVVNGVNQAGDKKALGLVA